MPQAVPREQGRPPPAIEGPVGKPDIWTPIRAIARWPVTTQIGARRNALVASTALTHRRRERDDVEQFLRTVNHAGPAAPGGPHYLTPGR